MSDYKDYFRLTLYWKQLSVFSSVSGSSHIGEDCNDSEDQGSYQHQMTSIHPYIAWNKNDTQLWGSMGYTKAGLSMEGKLHTFIDRDDYTEWGISGVIALPAAADGRGLSFSLSPSYGTTGSGASALWQQNQGQQNQLGSLGYAANDYQARLDARLGYGFAHGGSLLVPYSEMTTGASNSYRLGVQWQGNAKFDVNLFGERHESKGARAEHAILLEGRVQF